MAKPTAKSKIVQPDSRNILLVKISEIAPYENNSRTHSVEQVQQLAASFDKFGYTNPILIDEKNMIVAGHGRVMAAKAIYASGGQIKTPDGNILPKGSILAVSCAGWDDATRRAYIIADNKLALNAGWDEAKLAEELAALDEMDFDLSVTGFTDEELDDILDNDFEEDEKKNPAADNVPPVKNKIVVAVGEVWVLGSHKIICGDSTNKRTLTKLLEKEKANLLFTDPPYGMEFVGDRSTKETAFSAITNDDLKGNKLTEFLAGCLTIAKSFTTADAAAYVCLTYRTYGEFKNAMDLAKYEINNCIVWDKKSIGMSFGDYRPQHEFIFYCKGKDFYGDRSQSDVWEFSRGNTAAFVHPTQKPVELVEKALNNSSKKTDIVLDIFGGSGSTIIACEVLKRQARVVEIEPAYCDVIIRRWQEFTGKKAYLAGSKKSFDKAVAERL